MSSSHEGEGVSVVDAKLDEMVEAASRPTLADMFRKVKESGRLDTTVTNYGGQNAGA